ncbi:hypothetical protein M3Y99_00152900 [Aphelenchoides fujianensis]|nr:hypothetical protein M3Y99_00152900 [Aphelenchoides fujianensis]
MGGRRARCFLGYDQRRKVWPGSTGSTGLFTFATGREEERESAARRCGEISGRRRAAPVGDVERPSVRAFASIARRLGRPRSMGAWGTRARNRRACGGRPPSWSESVRVVGGRSAVGVQRVRRADGPSVVAAGGAVVPLLICSRRPGGHSGARNGWSRRFRGGRARAAARATDRSARGATAGMEKCGHWIYVRNGKIVGDCGDERTVTFCQGKSVQNDVGDGLHSWMSIEYKGTGDDGSRCVIAMYDKDGDLGEYHLPTTTPTTSISTSTSTSTTLPSFTSMLAVTTPIPHVVVTGTFECWGQPDSWGTVVVLNRRTDASGRRFLEFCGSAEMLPNGTLRMEVDGTANPEEVFYLIQHTCAAPKRNASFACWTGKLDQSEWAAKSVDLGRMGLTAAREKCSGKLADTLVPARSVDKCTAEEPMLDEMFGDLVDQLL